MAYDTGNPVGSIDPRDLIDNAENLDKAVNADEWTDRFGDPRVGLKKIEEDFPLASIFAAEAEVSASSASADAASAAGSKTLAEASAQSAESSAAAAQSASNTFDTTAQAIASPNVVNGQVFYIRTADPQVFNVWLKNSSGVAVDQGAKFDIATSASVKALTRKSLRWQGGLCDADGNMGFAIDFAGSFQANLGFEPNPIARSTGGYAFNIAFSPVYGQSLSVGQAVPAISLSQAYDNLMFVRGMRPQYDYSSETDAEWYASLVAAVEQTSPNPTWSSTLGETPATGKGDSIKQLMLSEDGLSPSDVAYQILLSTPGFGAVSIAGLSKGAGTGHYERMIAQAVAALPLCAAQNKTFGVTDVSFAHGESDYINNNTGEAYRAALATLVADLNADFKAATGQSDDVPLICYQVASHKVYGRTNPVIALAQTAEAIDNPLVFIACPMYQFTYQSSTNAHVTNISSRWMGAYFGLAHKRIVIDKQDWKPLQPISSFRQGALAQIKFHVPVGALEWDTEQVALNTNYGFELVDSAGNPLTIVSVTITGPDTVLIVAAATIPAGAKVRYARSGSGDVGNLVGPRGNLRDQQGDSIVFDPTGINKRIDNFSVMFEEIL